MSIRYVSRISRARLKKKKKEKRKKKTNTQAPPSERFSESEMEHLGEHSSSDSSVHVRAEGH